MEAIGAAGASLIAGILAVAMAIGSAYAGFWISERYKSVAAGWVVGIALYVVAVLIFGPSLQALREASCEGADDYSACMDGD